MRRNDVVKERLCGGISNWRVGYMKLGGEDVSASISERIFISTKYFDYE